MPNNYLQHRMGISKIAPYKINRQNRPQNNKNEIGYTLVKRVQNVYSIILLYS